MAEKPAKEKQEKPPEKEPAGKKVSFFKNLLAKKGLLLIGIAAAIAVIGGGVYYFLIREVDNAPPSINLTSPTADDWYATTESSITIEGLAVDNNEVESVAWETDKGESGTATISENSWSAADISLSQGDNKITITATDKKGNSASVELNVVYNTGILFYELTLNQDYIYKDESAEKITARAGVEATSEGTVEEVALYTIVNGEKEQLEIMLDNGKVANGDDIPSDNIYSIIYSFSSDSLDPIQLRVGAVLGGSSEVSYSGIITISVLEKPSAQELSKTLDTNDAINQKFEELKESETPEKAASALVDWLTEREDIETAGTSPDGLSVWWEYKKTGILGGIFQAPEGTKGHRWVNTGQEEQGAVQGITRTKVPIKFGVGQPAYASVGSPEVKSTKAIYLGPYYSDFGNGDDYHHAWQTILDSKCPECQTTEKQDADVTVEDFKTLSNYGLVVISSHGDTWFEGAFGTDEGKVVTLTSQVINSSNFLSYLADLLLQRLAIDARDNTLVVLPSFIKRYNGAFPNSLVYLSTCRSSYNFSMASAYLSKGAKAFFGYSEYVKVSYAAAAGKTMMESFLAQGKTAGESWIDSVNANGANDGSNPPAYFDIWGHTNLKMGGKDLQNGGFEEKLLGWGSAGDARVITALAGLTPREGKRMAIISTGLGSVYDSNSYLSQTICSKEGTLTISFKYDFVSEEPMEYVGSVYDDALTVTATINGTPTTLVSRTINNSSWSKVSGINFAGGDATTYHTGWATISKDLGEVEPNDIITLEFRVKDKGDSIYDSAALIDSVALEVE
jgi:hypothetical protein